MDSILDLIIFLVIVYGFLSPFFKKKKEGMEIPSEDSNGSEIVKPAPQRRDYAKYSETDVLTELEDFFRKTGTPADAEHSRPASESQAYKPEQVKEEKYSGTESKIQPKPVKSVLVPPQVPKPVSSPLPFTVPLDSPKPVVNQAALRVRALLKNPETLKDALILSEILRKPTFRYR